MSAKRTIDTAGPTLARLLFGWDGPMWRYRNPWGPWTPGLPPWQEQAVIVGSADPNPFPRLRLFGSRSEAAEDRVLAALSLHEWTYGLDALRRAGLRAGRFYRAVWDLEHRGLVESRWEPASEDPRRRMYRLVSSDSVEETQQP